MKETKGNELAKVTLVAVLAIGLFSMAFVGINNLAFAVATNKTESFPPVVATVNIPATETVTPEDYQKPELFVYDATDKTVAVNPNAISAEKAAELGAQYIWDMFGESINGKTVEMKYCVWPSHTRAYWMGAVADSADAVESFDLQFMFYLCADSGERADLHNLNPVLDGITRDAQWAAKQREIHVLLNEFMEKYRLEGRVAELDEMFSVKPTEQQLDEYGQLARDYATKHFNGTEVTNVEFLNGGSSVDLDEGGNFVKTDKSLTFKVTDSVGRCADVSVALETRALLYISSSNYDIIPGFNADQPGAVG